MCTDAPNQCKHSYSIQEKIAFVAHIDHIMKCKSISIWAACSDAKIDPKIYHNWKRAMSKLNSHENTSTMSSHPDVTLQLCKIINDLLKYIFKKREIGTPIAHMDIKMKA